jgi:hypothetical protein
MIEVIATVAGIDPLGHRPLLPSMKRLRSKTESGLDFVRSNQAIGLLIADAVQLGMQDAYRGTTRPHMKELIRAIPGEMSQVLSVAFSGNLSLRRLEKYMYHSEVSSARSPFVSAFMEFESDGTMTRIGPKTIRFGDYVADALLERETTQFTARRLRVKVEPQPVGGGRAGRWIGQKEMAICAYVDKERVASVPVATFDREMYELMSWVNGRAQASRVPVTLIDGNGREAE